MKDEIEQYLKKEGIEPEVHRKWFDYLNKKIDKIFYGLTGISVGGGVGVGDMLKSVYDTNANGIVDNSEKLEGKTLAEVRDHAPKAHHTTHEPGGTDPVSLNFKDLADTPSSYSGQASKVVAVKSTEDGLEFVSPAAMALNDLTDVTISSPSSGEYLRYDGANWVNSAIQAGDLPSHTHSWSDVDKTGSSINDLGDVTISSPSSGEYLRYDGANWVNSSIQKADLPTIDLNDLGDVTISSPSGGQVIAYDGSNWINTSAIYVSTSTNRVGIGGAPSYDFHLKDKEFALEASSGKEMLYKVASDSDSPYFYMVRGQGSLASPSAVQSGKTLGALAFGGYDGSSWRLNPVQIYATATENWSSSGRGADLKIWTTPAGSTVPSIRVVIADNGNVGIGTTDPEEKLEVDGNVKASGAIIGSLNGVLKASSGIVNGNAELDDLDDVSISSPSDGQVLTYNSTTGKWENKAAAGGGFNSRVRVYLSSDQSIDGQTTTKINFDTEDYDGNNEWDTSTYKFTAANAGYYLITCRLYWDATFPSERFTIYIYKNGSNVSLQGWRYSSISTGSQMGHITDILYLAAGDTIEFYVYQNDTSAHSLRASSKGCFAAIHRLS